MGLRMLSVGQHPAFLHQIMSPARYQIVLQGELNFSQHLRVVCCLTLYMRYWVGAEASHFHSKAMIMNYKALEGRGIAVSSPFIPTLLLTESPDYS